MADRLRHSKYFVLLIFFFVLANCSGEALYSKFTEIKNASWEKNSPCDFEFMVTDTINSYDVFVEVRSNNDYMFRNLWLFVCLTTPDGSVRQDTLNCELADVYGKWHGKGNSLYTLDFLYEDAICFPDTGTYTYSVRQGMREDPLKGISDIGLRVVKHIKQ